MTTKCYIETEGVNDISIKLLPTKYKRVYTFIKKNDGVSCKEILKKFSKYDIKDILLDLKDMFLIYLTDDDKVIDGR